RRTPGRTGGPRRRRPGSPRWCRAGLGARRRRAREDAGSPRANPARARHEPRAVLTHSGRETRSGDSMSSTRETSTRRDRTHWLYIMVIVAVVLGAIVGGAAPDFVVKLQPLGDCSSS